MATNNFGTLVLNQNTIKFVFVLAIVLGAFLFLAPKQAEAARGYGWMGPWGMSNGRSGTCGFPFDSDVWIYVLDSTSGALINADFIEVLRVGSGTTTGSGAALLIQCWNPTAGVYVKVSEPGFRNFYGGVYWYNDSPRGNTARLIVFMARSSGGCYYDCPSIETVEPTGSGSIDWFYDRPTTWQVRARLFPADSGLVYGSNAIDDWMFELRQTSGCCYPGFAGYLDLGFNGGKTWAASKNFMTTSDVTTEVNSKIPPSLPDGRYAYSFMASSNGLPGAGTMDPDSAFPTQGVAPGIGLDWTEFGIDRVTPDDLAVWHAKPTAPGVLNPRVYEDEQYQMAARARDRLSGLARIQIYRVTNTSPTPLDVNNDALWGAPVQTCTYAPDNNFHNCLTALFGPGDPPGDWWVHYRACPTDLVGNRRCEGNRFQIEIVDPWIETFDGDIGSRWGINQKRDLTSPDAVGTPHTSNFIISTRTNLQNNVDSLRNWRLRNYDINMAKFPEPVGNSIYDALWQKYSTRCRGGPLGVSMAGITPGALAVQVAAAESSRGCRILEATDVFDINDNSWFVSGYSGNPVVIFVPNYDGLGISMWIRRNMVIASQTGIIFVTKGSINVCKNHLCGNPLTPVVDSISGFYVSDRPMYTDVSSTSTPADPRLTIYGSVISFEPAGLNWRRDSGGYGRSMNSALNRDFPSEQIRYQPKYLWLFRQELGDVRTITQEIPP